MPDNRKKLIWLVVLASLGALVFIFYILNSTSTLSGPKKVQKNYKFTGIFAENKNTPPQDYYYDKKDFITPAIDAFGEAVSSIFDQSAQNFSSQSEPAQNKSPSFQIFSAPPPIVTVSEKEIFEFGYSEDYKIILRDINQGMIDGEFLKDGDIYKLDTMADAIALQDKYADYLESLMVGIEGGGLTKSDIDKYRQSYRDILPNLWKEELIAGKSISKNSSIFEKIYFTYRKKTAQQKVSRELSLYQIREIFINTAEAAHSINPCYREGTPNNQLGSQRAAPCCNCGITGSRCRSFVNDCGEGRCRCANFGCLNRACPGLPAIWDPQTKICGCHVGGGSFPPLTTTPTPSTTPTPTDKKYACNSNNQCVEDASGQYTNSNCDSQCPVGLKCSAATVSAITNAMVSCVISKAAAAGLSVPQPASNQLNQGCHTCQFSGNTNTSCASFKNASPTRISCHYGGPSCNGTGHAADFTVSPASSANWNKLMNIVTDVTTDSSGNPVGCGRYVRGARCENNDGVNVGCGGSPTHIHANDADQCGCN